MNCMVFGGFGGMDMWLSMGFPRTHRMLDLNWAMHVQVLGRHTHCINHPELSCLGASCAGCRHL
jgi:hypothetical protein